jgi:predicted RNA-binding protein
MAGRNYWLDLFTAVTWQEFLDAGGKVSGFRESRWNTLQKIKVGNYFLCYLTGISRWIGLLEVTSEPFRDTATIWKDESFPCRVKVKVVAKLTPETGVPVKEMKDQLSVFSRLDPRLAEICRYISFDALRERLGQVKDFVRYLKPDFLEELSEACDLEQE